MPLLSEERLVTPPPSERMARAGRVRLLWAQINHTLRLRAGAPRPKGGGELITLLDGRARRASWTNGQ